MSHLVKVILVELSNEAGKVAVFEVFGKDGFGESFVLPKIMNNSIGNALSVESTSNTTKLSISSPHLTTEAYDGSSSILRHPSVLSPDVAPDFRIGGMSRIHTCTVFAPIFTCQSPLVSVCERYGDLRNHSSCLRSRHFHSDCRPFAHDKTRTRKGDSGVEQLSNLIAGTVGVLIPVAKSADGGSKRLKRSFGVWSTGPTVAACAQDREAGMETP